MSQLSLFDAGKRRLLDDASGCIELTPDFTSLALPGVETVEVEVREPVTQVTLNVVNTIFGDVTVDDGVQELGQQFAVVALGEERSCNVIEECFH